MYLPKAHEEARIDVLHGLLRAHPLGTWVALNGTELLANHMPFFIDPTRGEFGTLMAHVARANPLWQLAPSPVAHVVAFQGPQAYVSPSWYPSKHAHGKAVPTWNYAVVHAHGHPRFIEDPAWLLAFVTRLTQVHEAPQTLPWAVTDAPADYIDKLLGAIVGVEIPIQRLVGKWKTSQNRPVADQWGVVAGLTGQGGDAALAMAALMHAAVKS